MAEPWIVLSFSEEDTPTLEIHNCPSFIENYENKENDIEIGINLVKYTFPNKMFYYKLNIEGEPGTPSRIHYGITDKDGDKKDNNYIILSQNPPDLELTIDANIEGKENSLYSTSHCFSESVIRKFIEYIEERMRVQGDTHVRGAEGTSVEFKNPVPLPLGVGHSAPAAGGKRTKRTGRKQKSKRKHTNRKRTQKRATKKQSRRVK